jgi:transcription antitermination factor NusG
MNPWYAVRVKPNFERTAALSLRGRGIPEFLPLYRTLRRWSDREKMMELPLFPGYIFAQLNPEIRTPILSSPGILAILGIGKTPVPVDPAELEAIRNVAREGLPCEPWPFLREGQRVRVTAGGLAGVEGLLLSLRNANHLVLQVSLLQRSVLVHLDRHQIAPIL